MPIVKCLLCGRMGYEVPPRMDAREMEKMLWLGERVCRHCGKRRLARAVWGKDYGFDPETGERFGHKDLATDTHGPTQT